MVIAWIGAVWILGLVLFVVLMAARTGVEQPRPPMRRDEVAGAAAHDEAGLPPAA